MTSVDRLQAASAPRAPRWYVVLLLLAAASVWLYLTPGATTSSWRGDTMGTTWVVKLGVALDPEQADLIEQTIRGELDFVVSRMSTYEEHAEVARFAKAPADEPFEMSAATIDVLLAAQKVTTTSSGAFDVTVRPLVEAWGFGAAGRPEQVPSAETLDAVRARVGADKLRVDRAARTVTKTVDGVSIDLSGIAKGYAVDRIAAALEANGLEDYLVEIGGETRARGNNERGTPWRIAVRRPGGAGALAIRPNGRGVATSGNDRNFYVRDGQRYAHTIDPRTGAPVRHHLAGVSVIHETTALADAWATALLVLGDEEGLRVAKANDLAVALFVMTSSDELVTVTTTAYDAFVERSKGEP